MYLLMYCDVCTDLFRVFWYLVPVVLLSVLLNIPKFLETEYYYTSTKEETNATK